MTFYASRLPAISAPPSNAHPDDLRRLKHEMLGAGLAATADVRTEALRRAKDIQRVRSGASHGLDLVLAGGTWVNPPFLSIEDAPHAPTLEMEGDDFVVQGSRVRVAVELLPKPGYYAMSTSKGIPMREIGQMCGDRIGFGLTNGCYFWAEHRRCRFCSIGSNVANEVPNKPIDAILATLEAALHDDVLPPRHVLLSGGTPPGADRGVRRLAETCVAIRRRFDLPVYVMAVPPDDLGELDALRQAGVGHVALNIEVFDPERAAAVVPGKHREVGRERYLAALRWCVERWPEGCVRSLFVVGVEPLDSTLRGVEMITSMGVQPILSVFRPLEGSDMHAHARPEADALDAAWLEGTRLASRQGLTLGPTCIACQNNTVA